MPDVFEAERPRLLGLAYRMLGLLADAEDVVQDAWLRWQGADQTVIERPEAWLTTVTTRLALDRVRTVERRREEYVGPWLPEPVALGAGPEDHVELAESLTLGFLVLLDRLSPTERAVFLLADVFGEPYTAIAEAVGKSPDNCRQIASRARRRVRGAEADAPARPADQALITEMLAAVSLGDVAKVLSLLDPEVVLVSDGGPHRKAARHPVAGAARVVRFLVNIAERYPPTSARIIDVNGAPALLADTDLGPYVFAADQRDGKVTTIRVMLNPDKLAGVTEAHSPLH